MDFTLLGNWGKPVGVICIPTIYKEIKTSKVNFTRYCSILAVKALFDSILIFFFGLFYQKLKNGTNMNYIRSSSNVYIIANQLTFFYFSFKMEKIFLSYFFSTITASFVYVLGLYFSELTYQLDIYDDNVLNNFTMILFDAESFFLNVFLFMAIWTAQFLIEKHSGNFIFSSSYENILGLISDQSIFEF